MKRIITLLLVLTAVVMSAEAENSEKKFRKILNRYDVAPEAIAVPADSNPGFWETALGADRNLARLNRDIAKGKGLERKALAACTKMPKFYPEYNSFVRSDLQPWADSLMATVGLPCDSIATRLYVVDNPRAEAFAPLTEEGFAIVVTTGLVCNQGCDDDILKGIISAQASHGALRHQLQFFYDEAKRRRRDNIWGGIDIGALVAADVALAMTDSYYDDYFTYNDFSTTNINVNTDGETAAPVYIYSADQIYQADLWAYRMMERLGKGESYIRALKLLSPQVAGAETAKESSPGISDRIKFINFVASQKQ